ncbi:MAG: hypothetical protein ABGY96_12245 [bacterium]|nr:hypothetical protein [Gammaproteobacteria bacterium]HIL98713.1 hypothetical protein [Pseudomonadales bacterium]
MTTTHSAFRLGDIRGVYPVDVDEEFARQFAHAFIQQFRLSGNIATGRDTRESSVVLQHALNDGLVEAGINVFDLGLCPTELGSFAAAQNNIEAAIIVTASHNAPRYNGFKCMLKPGKEATFRAGLADIEQLMHANTVITGSAPGLQSNLYLDDDYTRFIKSSLKIEPGITGSLALNGLNGTATILATRLVDEYELNCTWFRQNPGPMPSQGAEPTHPQLANEMRDFMSGKQFELGIAWDGDCDRCVFFDHDGELIPTYYIIGLFAEHALKSDPGAAIVYDTKLCWNTLDIIRQNEGKPIRSETGHAFMKEKMRAHNAVYGGELSSHHYFKDFFSSDSGMYAWLKALEITQQSGKSVAELIQHSREKYLCTPEISLNLADVDSAFNEMLKFYNPLATHVDDFDGLSFEMPGDWRFSLRRSKTESLVRLNLESIATGESILNEGATLLSRLLPFQAEDADWHSRLLLQ